MTDATRYISTSCYRLMWKKIGFEYRFAEQEFFDSHVRPSMRMIGRLGRPAMWRYRTFRSRWQAKSLSAGTMKNRLCALRWWTEKVGKAGLIPAANAQLGIPERQFLTNENKARELGDRLSRVSDEHVQMSLRLQQAFGLRREEAIKFTPAYADRGDCIVLKGSWTKGGRERSIPITQAAQRALLEQAHVLTGIGSLIPAHKTYVVQLRLYEGSGRDSAHRGNRMPGIRRNCEPTVHGRSE